MEMNNLKLIWNPNFHNETIKYKLERINILIYADLLNNNTKIKIKVLK